MPTDRSLLRFAFSLLLLPACADDPMDGDSTAETSAETAGLSQGESSSGDSSGDETDGSSSGGDESGETSGDTDETSGDSADTSGDTDETSGDTDETSGDTDDTSGDTDDTSGDTSGEPPAHTDPNCVDGMYQESLSANDVDLSDLFAAYQPANRVDFVMEALSRRYPIGHYIVEESSAQSGDDCAAEYVDSGFSDPEDPASLLRGTGTIVHECGHGLNLGMGFIESSHYVINDSLLLKCDRPETIGRGAIDGDEFSPAVFDDFYRDTYLVELGDQGFEMLLEETSQYVNSLATGYAFLDQYDDNSSTSARDGLLSFLWYVERYLYLTRNQYPDSYDALVGDPCWREAILTVWGRGWKYLEATEGLMTLGIDDEEILEALLNPTLLAEIQLVRDAHGC